MPKIAIFYHTLFYLDGHFLENAVDISGEQVGLLHDSGLMKEASSFVVGINGGRESLGPAAGVLPPEADLFLHGLDSKNENSTILLMEEWVKAYGDDYYVLYFHCKGATKPSSHPDHRLTFNWRKCMMRNLVEHWRVCVRDLDAGCDAVGCHWMSGDKTPPGQSIFAGNFWWAKSAFLKTVPSIMLRDRIRVSGLKSVDSRYESEVWLCNGPVLPKVKDYHPAWIDTCSPQ